MERKYFDPTGVQFKPGDGYHLSTMVMLTDRHALPHSLSHLTIKKLTKEMRSQYTIYKQ